MSTDPTASREGVRVAFRLAIEEHLARIPADADPLTALGEIHARLQTILQSTPIKAADVVEETRHRALLAAQLAAAADEIRARYGQGRRRLAS